VPLGPVHVQRSRILVGFDRLGPFTKEVVLVDALVSSIKLFEYLFLQATVASCLVRLFKLLERASEICTFVVRSNMPEAKAMIIGIDLNDHVF